MYLFLISDELVDTEINISRWIKYVDKLFVDFAERLTKLIARKWLANNHGNLPPKNFISMGSKFIHDKNVRTNAFIAARHNGHAFTLGAHWTQVTMEQKNNSNIFGFVRCSH